MMNKLYVSDLDGTLLTPGGKLSDFTKEKLNELIADGLNFTIATARSASTAVKILEGVKFNLPVILMNGVVLYDTQKNEYVFQHGFEDDDARKLLEILHAKDLPAFVYTIEDGQLICYTQDDSKLTEEMRVFKDERVHDYGKKYTYFDSYEELMDEEVIYITMLGDYEELKSMAVAIESISTVESILYVDVYTNDWILEIHKRGVDKGVTVEWLKNSINADELTVFADNTNDLPMVEIADLAMAVENANDEVKEACDVIIGSNKDNSVLYKLIELVQ